MRIVNDGRDHHLHPLTVVIASTYARADSYRSELLESEGLDRGDVRIVSTSSPFPPHGVWPDRVVWVEGWSRGIHSIHHEEWAIQAAVTRPGTEHTGNTPVALIQTRHP